MKRAEVEKKALNFLQNKALELREMVPNLVSAEVEKGKIVLTVRGTLDNVPTLEYQGVTFNVSVKETTADAPVVGESELAKKIAANDAKVKAIMSQYPGMVSDDKVYKHESKVAVGPGTTVAKDQKALAAWKKRHGKEE